MLTRFDWLRRSRNGEELIATIDYFKQKLILNEKNLELGPPASATDVPCQRCEIYACASNERHCRFCGTIVRNGHGAYFRALQSIYIWGYVSQIPKQVVEEYESDGACVYIHDDQHFLKAIHRLQLKDWLQRLLLYNAGSLKGLFQIFPSAPHFRGMNVGEGLCWVVHHENILPMNDWRVRFYPEIYDTVKPHVRDRQGMLTFNISEFLSMLDMARVFKHKLRPFEQKQLRDLLNQKNRKNDHFFWGRFLGELDQEAKDMLSEWKIRQWEPRQTTLLYDLIGYVTIPATD